MSKWRVKTKWTSLVYNWHWTKEKQKKEKSSTNHLIASCFCLTGADRQSSNKGSRAVESGSGFDNPCFEANPNSGMSHSYFSPSLSVSLSLFQLDFQHFIALNSSLWLVLTFVWLLAISLVDVCIFTDIRKCCKVFSSVVVVISPFVSSSSQLNFWPSLIIDTCNM